MRLCDNCGGAGLISVVWKEVEIERISETLAKVAQERERTL